MPGVSSAGSLVGILSMVTGLLVSFRCSTSYDRYATLLFCGVGMERADISFHHSTLDISTPFFLNRPHSFQMVRGTSYMGLDSIYYSQHATSPRLCPPSSVRLTTLDQRRFPLSSKQDCSRTLLARLRIPFRLYVPTSRSTGSLSSGTSSTPTRTSPSKFPFNSRRRSSTLDR